MKILTSETSPLRVDFLPPEAGGWPGRIGLTIAPGKKAPGIGGDWRRDLETDLRRLCEVHGASVLVPLCEADELVRLGIGDLHERARAHGLVVEAFPFPDGGVPESTAAVLPLVRAITAAAERGETVVIHCRGGLGRSGTVAACVLVASGAGAEAAMRVVRAARPGAIENAEQETFVRAFAASGG